MKQYAGFEVKKSGGSREVLPAGGYVAKILGAKEVAYQWGEVLVISFDIVEGAYQEFFATDYRAQNQEDKRWRGTYRLTHPKEDGSEKDGWTIHAFNHAVAVLEECNPGYHWDWAPMEQGDFSQLKGKLLGVLFRNKEWEMQDMTGWTTECCGVAPVEDIRRKKYKMPKDKALKQMGSPGSRGEEAAFSGDGDIPF